MSRLYILKDGLIEDIHHLIPFDRNEHDAVALRELVKKKVKGKERFQIYDLATKSYLTDDDSLNAAIKCSDQALKFLLVLEDDIKPPKQLNFVDGDEPEQLRPANQYENLWTIPRIYTPTKITVGDQELEEYKLRASYCQEETQARQVLKEFQEVVEDVYKYGRTTHRIPFVFVCSSSGMGKTQLPFTLDIPMLYFTYKPSDSQKIYSKFRNLSSELTETLDRDQAVYHASYPASQNTLIQMSERMKFKSWTAGFLVKLLENVYKMKSRNPEISWIDAELTCPSFNYEPIDIESAQERIRKIRDNSNLAIFIDEAVNLKDSEFKFKRSLIRLLGLALVIMGTNANAANFVQKSGFEGSRDDDQYPWCYVFHKLPSMSSGYLDATYFKQIRENVKSWKSKHKQKLGQLVDSLFSILVQERPLFAIWAADFLQTFVEETIAQNRSIDSRTIASFMADLSQDIFLHFVENKKVSDDPDFSVGQLDFIDPRPEKNELSSMRIHKHLGFISESDDIEKSTCYFPLFLMESQLKWRRKSHRHLFKEFKAYSIMPDFFKMPLTGLSFSGSTTLTIDQFAMAKKRSAIQLNLLFEEIRKSEARNDTRQMDGKFLERVCDMAMQLATHSCGLSPEQGKVFFRDVFPHFLRELQADYGQTKPTVIFDDPHWAHIDVEPVPYCATSNASWNPIMSQLLSKQAKCYLGHMGRMPNSPLDVTIFKSPLGTIQNTEIFGTEAKARAKNKTVDKSIIAAKLKTIADKFGTKKGQIPECHRAKIVVIVATSFSDFHKFKSKEEREKEPKKRKTDELSLEERLDLDNIWLVKLERDENDNNTYRFATLYTPDTVTRVCILVDIQHMLTINGEVDQVYANIQEYCTTNKS